MDLKKLIEILDKHVDEKALAKELAIYFVIPFLEKVVLDSENKFDDIAFAEVKKFIEKL